MVKLKVKYHFEYVSKSVVNMYFGAGHTTVGNITGSKLDIQQGAVSNGDIFAVLHFHYFFYLFPEVFCILKYFSAIISYTFYLAGFTLLTCSISWSGTHLKDQGKYFLFFQLTKEGSDEAM